jgi:hypothetical protein
MPPIVACGPADINGAVSAAPAAAVAGGGDAAIDGPAVFV